MNLRVLLVEDEELVGTMIRMNLESVGYEVHWIRDGERAFENAKKQGYDLILLDIALPNRDGITLLQNFRQAGITTPIMMVTARSDVETKVQALEIGADDYLPKPFDVSEMIARVNALVRRSQAERQIPSDNLVSISGFEINLATRQATSNEGEVMLSEKETALIRLLVRSQGQVLSRADILDEVWGMDVSPSERTVDNFIVRLRKLFEPDTEKPRHFITVRGEGYRFVP